MEGRERELQNARAALDDASVLGVVFTGRPGIGTSHMATTLAAELVSARDDAGTEVWNLYPGGPSREQPGGVLAAGLPLDPAALDVDPALALKRTLDARSEPVVIVVDGAHALDERSAEALVNAVGACTSQLILTQSSGDALPSAFDRRVRAGDIVRIELGPLPDRAIIAIAEDICGAQLAPRTADRVVALSRGFPLHARELTTAALDAGELRDDGGGYMMGAVPGRSARLSALVADRFDGLPSETTDAVLAVAVAQPTAPHELESFGTDAVGVLERAGLISVTQDQRRLRVAIDHPLHREILLGRASPITLRRIRLEIGSRLLDLGARRSEDRYRLALWSLDGRDPVPTDYLVEASRVALQNGEADVAALLGRAAFDQEPGFDTGRALETALYELGDWHELDAHYREWTPFAVDDDQRALAVAATTTGRYWRGGDATCVDELIDAAGHFEQGRHRADLNASAAMHLVTQGRIDEALRLAVPLADEPPGRAMIHVTLALGHGYRAAGRPATALAALDRAATIYRAAGPEVVIVSDTVLNNARLQTLAELGRFHEADEQAEAALPIAREVGDDTAVGLGYVALGWSAVLQGDLDGARREAANASRWLLASRHAGMARWSLGVEALAAAMAGDTDDAKRLLGVIDDIGDHPARIFESIIERARAWVAHLGGYGESAAETLRQAASDARSVGNVVNELTCWLDLARFGGAVESSVRVAELADGLEGALTPAYVAYVQALAGSGQAAHRVAADSLDALGQAHLVAEVAQSAAMLASRDGDAAGVASWLDRAYAARESSRSPGSPAFEIDPTVALTRREREVVLLAARGLTNKEIGERLYISTRTAETHLARAYTKFGVHDRAQLSALLSASAGRTVAQ